MCFRFFFLSPPGSRREI